MRRCSGVTLDKNQRTFGRLRDNQFGKLRALSNCRCDRHHTFAHWICACILCPDGDAARAIGKCDPAWLFGIQQGLEVAGLKDDTTPSYIAGKPSEQKGILSVTSIASQEGPPDTVLPDVRNIGVVDEEPILPEHLQAKTNILAEPSRIDLGSQECQHHVRFCCSAAFNHERQSYPDRRRPAALLGVTARSLLDVF